MKGKSVSNIKINLRENECLKFKGSFFARKWKNNVIAQ